MTKPVSGDNEQTPAPLELPASYIVSVFEMAPDDVVLIGGIAGGQESVQRFMDWAKAEWPNRKIVCFADDIDVRLLNEFLASQSSDNSKRQALLAEYGECICIPGSCDDDLHGDGFCPPCAHMDPYWSCFNDEDDPWPPVDKDGDSDV